MKHNIMLRVASLLTLLLTTIHLTQDFMAEADLTNRIEIPVVIFAVWLYATLMLSDRISGYIIMLLGGLIGAMMIVLHTRGGIISNSRGFFFVWTLFALSTTGWFTAILATRGLWTTFRDRRAGTRIS